MSDLAATHSDASTRPWPLVGLVCAVAAAVIWVLAGVIDGALYPVTGVLGIAGFAAGLKGRRDARRGGGWTWAAALTAMFLGGLLGGAVVVASVYFVVSELVS